MEKKNQVLMSVLGVFALVIVTVGVSYAFFTYTRTSEYENIINAGEVEFGFVDTEQELELSEAYPVLEATAKAVDASTDNVLVYNFNVHHKLTGTTAAKYRISLVNTSTVGDTNAFSTDNVKVSLFQAESQAALDDEGTTSTQIWKSTLTSALASPHIVTIDNTTGTTTDKTTYYRLKMWLDADTLNIAASDKNGNGIIEDGENFTTDNQNVTADWANKYIKVKVKVDAGANADGNAIDFQ